MYKKLKFSEEVKSKISYWKGFQDEDHNDELDVVYQETLKNQQPHWWIVEHGPLVGMIVSVSTCLILIIVSSFWDATDMLMTASYDSYHRLMHDLPSFIMSVLYPIPCFVSIWFCIFFIEWQKNVYSSIRRQIRTIKKSNFDEEAAVCTKLNDESKNELERLCYMINKLQRIFILLNKKIFQKTLVLDFTLFLFLGVYLSVKILGDETNFAFVFPLSLIIGHIYLVCKWSSDLMGEFNEINEVLNEMHEGDVEDLRRELQECPPQVCAFGGFGVDYTMMTALIAFMLSIISISGMFWPDIQAVEPESDQCYEYHDKEEGWNNTLCVTQYCYNYKDQSGSWNNTFCVNNKLKDNLFFNGTLSVKNTRY